MRVQLNDEHGANQLLASILEPLLAATMRASGFPLLD